MPLRSLQPRSFRSKQPAEKLARGVTDDDRVGLRDPLQVRRQIRRLANDLALVRVLRSDQFADHHHAGCDADADLQRPARFQRADRGGQFESRPHRPLSVVLVSPRIAKVHEHAIAHVSRDEAIETMNDVGGTILIRRK